MIIGTAGHVDHGKTALIRALTGIDTDRLKEEKERGLSIELGFAHIRLPSGGVAGIVDVPGHERFVRTMLAGATGMDLVLLVIAADEGVMPQTREHLEILQLLQVQRGVIVLTKVDLVEPAWLEMMKEDVRSYVRGTFLENAPIVPVSSVTGEGLEQLVKAVDAVAREAAARDLVSPCRLPVDRVFTRPGYGTVVTGTLAVGTISTGDRLEVLPARLATRARGIQVHGEKRDRAQAGERVAINLAGLEVPEAQRGNIVAAPGIFRPTTAVDVLLNMLSSAKHPLRRGARVRVHIYTDEVLARAYPLEANQLAPGGSGPVRLRLERSTAAARGDRLVIRTHSPMITIGGGSVLDAHPPLRAAAGRAGRPSLLPQSASTEDLVAHSAAGEPGLALDKEALVGRLGLTPEQIEEAIAGLVRQGRLTILLPDGAVVDSARYTSLGDEIEAALRSFHAQQPLRFGLTHEEIRSRLSLRLEPRLLQHALSDLTAAGRIERQNARFFASGHHIEFTPHQKSIAQRIESAFLSSPFSPPALAEVLAPISDPGAQDVVAALFDMGTLEKVGDLVFHSHTVERARSLVVQHLHQHGTITAAEFRNLIGSSRKYALPLLEFFDSRGITTRVGDERRLGPNAPQDR